MRKAPIVTVFLLAGCSAPGGPYPSLRPRAAEAVDPRVPVSRPLNNRPVNGTLAARLGALVAEARRGEAAFDEAAASAERIASTAGPRQSESWIAAEEALTAAIAARRLTATALADIDEFGAGTLQSEGGLAPNDLLAINSAAEEVASIDQRQAARIAAIQRRLGI